MSQSPAEQSSATQPLFNQYARLMRNFFIVGCAFLAISIPFGLILLIARPDHNSGMYSGCLMGVIIPLPFATAMLLVPLMMIPRAGFARRTLAEFAAGNALAHWQYADDVWQAKIAADRRKWRNGGWVAFVLIFAMGAFISYMTTLSQYETTHEKVIDALVAGGITIALSTGVLMAVRFFSAARCHRLEHCGEAYIGHHGAYCGGDFIFWGKGTQVLRNARLIAGDPLQIELVCGLSPTMAKFAAAADLVSAATLHPTYSSAYTVRQLIPVPHGGEAVARALVDQLTQEAQTRPIGAKASPVRPGVAGSAANAAAAMPRIPKPSPTLEMYQHRAHRWWLITLTMAGTGFLLFAWSVALQLKNGTDSQAGSTRGLWGFCLFFLAIVPLIVAAVKTFSVRRMRQREHETAKIL
jgi:uncharacterized membrane protein YhaH (DUF805 family)